MNDFKGRHLEGQVILWAVRWHCKSGVSIREMEEMLEERGVAVDHRTIHAWTQRYAPLIEKRLRWDWHRPRSTSGRVDETYVKVRGRWSYQWSTRKHGASRPGSRHKVHPGIDAETLEVRAIESTGSRVGDAPMLPERLAQIPAEEPIGLVAADGAYNPRPCHAAIAARQASAVIPTRRNDQP